jgi:hypothetical protein
MDPLTAISLAGNVVQFIDFGCKILSKAREIQRNGSVQGYGDLQAVTIDLEKHITTLQDGLSNVRNATPTAAIEDEDDLLRNLCDGCLRIAKELQDALRKCTSDGPVSKWKSVRQACKAIRGKECILELKSTLESYNAQIDRRLLLSIKYG